MQSNFKHPTFMVTLVFLVQIVPAQTVWQRSYGGAGWDYGACIQQTTDGGYIITGSTNSFGNEDQVYLIKTDSLGDTLWSKIYGGTGDDYGGSVRQTTDGGYVIAGSTTSFGNGYQVYLIKTDSLGDTLWTNNYGGIEEDQGYSTQQTSDGGYIITGYTSSYGNGYQVYLVKTNAIGDTIWTKAHGTANYEWGFCVDQTNDGGYIIVGDEWSSYKAYLVKTDSLGDTLWTKTYGPSYIQNWGRSVQQTADSGFIVVGGTISTPHCWFVLLIKTDSLGGILWGRTYGTSDWDTYTLGQSVQQTLDGGYVIVGKTNVIDDYYQILLMRTNATGDSLWAKMYGGGGSEEGLYVQQCQDGGYVIVGTSRSWGNSDQVYVIKTDADGNTYIDEDKQTASVGNVCSSTIFCSNWPLPKNRPYRIIDISGRITHPEQTKPGVYFIEIDGEIQQKVIKVK